MASKYITIQTVDDELREKVKEFLIPSISALAKAGLENYMDLANKYGIDAEWRVNVPNDSEKAGHDAT